MQHARAWREYHERYVDFFFFFLPMSPPRVAMLRASAMPMPLIFLRAVTLR